MKRISVLIEGSSKKFNLKELFAIKNVNSYLFVKKATLFWDYNNITDENNELTDNGNKKTIQKGYWSFNMLKKEIESYGNVTLVANEYDGTYSITSDNAINMKTIGPILGFNKDQETNANTKTKSGNPVNINNGLQYIKITCNLNKILENINTNGEISDVIAVLPITTTQSLKGSVQRFFESRVLVDNRFINNIDFNVKDQDCNTKSVGKVLLDLYIM